MRGWEGQRLFVLLLEFVAAGSMRRSRKPENRSSRTQWFRCFFSPGFLRSLCFQHTLVSLFLLSHQIPHLLAVDRAATARNSAIVRPNGAQTAQNRKPETAAATDRRSAACSPPRLPRRPRDNSAHGFRPQSTKIPAPAPQPPPEPRRRPWPGLPYRGIEAHALYSIDRQLGFPKAPDPPTRGTAGGIRGLQSLQKLPWRPPARDRCEDRALRAAAARGASSGCL